MTYTSFGLRFSAPEMLIRQGLTLARIRPRRRNQRPFRSRRGSTSNSLIVPSSGAQSRMRAAVAAQIQADRRQRIIRTVRLMGSVPRRTVSVNQELGSVEAGEARRETSE